MTNNMPEAYVSSNHNRLRIYSGNQVYLKSGQHFEIELFNPTRDTVAAKIYINGKVISGSMIVIKPGERHFLDRYIDVPKKFLFETYEVENSHAAREAIADNGKLSIEFFKEKTQQPLPTYISPNSGSGWSGGGWNGGFPGSYTTLADNNNNFTVNSYYASSAGSMRSFSSDEIVKRSNKVETGRVQEGANSDQDFYNYNGQFEGYYFYTTSYQIMPESTKPVEINKLRQYCPGCRTRIRKQSWKFCPACGESLND